jgi:hypothetical protein
MIQFLLIYAGFLTLFIIGLIHYYEEKIMGFIDQIDVATQGLKMSREVMLSLSELVDEENKALIVQINNLKKQLAESDGEYWAKMYHEAIKNKSEKLQYESHAYQPRTWSKEIYGDAPYINPWNRTKGEE